MPRLPRVTSTALHRASARAARGRPSRARAGSSPMRTPSSCSTSDSLGVQAVMPRKPAARSASRRAPDRRPLARRGEFAARAATSAASRARCRSRRRAARPRARGLHERALERAPVARPTAPFASRDRCGRPAAWPSGRRRRGCASSSASGRPPAGHAAHVDAPPHAPRAGAGRLVAAGDADRGGAPAERRDVVGGVAGAARHDLRRVVVEDQDRRLARHARDARRR